MRWYKECHMAIRKLGSTAADIIFARPLLASLTVGTLIHAVTGFGELITGARSPLASWSEAFDSDPLYTAVRFTVPYLVAGWVTHTSRRVGRREPLRDGGADSDSLQSAAMAQCIEQMTRPLSQMIDLLDSAFARYDPIAFDVSRHDQLMFQALLTPDPQSLRNHPTHLFHVNWANDKLSGYVYHYENGEVFRSLETIEIPASENRYAIFSGTRAVVLENWEGTGVDLDTFQRRFHPRVREIVGRIERYVTYRSGSVAIIAFFRGRRLDAHDALILKGLTTFSQSLHRITVESRESEQAFRYLVAALARASEANDEDTGAHINRINKYSRLLAEALGQDSAFVDTIHYSAQMHDVGKIHVHPDILKKPGALTEDEYRQMKAHCTYGAHILGDSPRLAMAREIARYHHEKFNGRGYPGGLKGEEIPLSARIVALVDVYDALRQPRVYKSAYSHARAIEIITRGDERTRPDDFDPAVLEAFLRVEATMDAIYRANPD
jgi:response regulator RpfG family c-di-GMP phosphodiesterase